MKPRCKDCKHWLPYQDQPDIGLCRREPSEKWTHNLRFQLEFCDQFAYSGKRRPIYRMMKSEDYSETSDSDGLRT